MLISLLLLVASVPQSVDLQPKLEACRLLMAGKELVPLHASEGAGRVQAESGWELEVSARDVLVRRAGASEEPARVRASSEGLVCRKVVGDIAWLVDEDSKLPEIQRLDLKQLKWLPKLVLGDLELGLEKREAWSSSVSYLLSDDTALFALREDLVGGLHGPAEPDSYVVVRLDVVSGKVAWARRFPCVRSEAGAGAALLGPMLTSPSHASTRALQRFGEGLLVCTASAESLVLLGPEKGETKWSVDRVWEFQRGYIGPSVWSHFLGRFGIEAFGTETEEEKASIIEHRKSFDALYTTAVTAGPFLVRKKIGPDASELAMLLVVATAPHDPWSKHLTQQFVYEITAQGRPVSVVALPRGVLGWTATTSADRAVFACMHGAFACAATSENTGSIGMMVGNAPDATGALLWYREFVPSSHECWMSCDPAGDPVALTAELGVRPAGGGWIERETDSTFHFPLWLIDPRDGNAREVELRVPFDGQLSKPSTNYRSDGKGMHTWGMRGLGLTYLRLEGDRLCVWLANTKQVWRLEFDALELKPAK